MDLNRILIAGRLTGDPEKHLLPSGDSVTNVRLAVNRKWRDKETTELREETCFVDGKAYGKRAEPLAAFFHKGKPILVEGHLRMEQWEKEGERRTKHVIVIDAFHFVDAGERGDGAEALEGSVAANEPARSARPAALAPAKAPAARGATPAAPAAPMVPAMPIVQSHTPEESAVVASTSTAASAVGTAVAPAAPAPHADGPAPAPAVAKRPAVASGRRGPKRVSAA